MIYQIMYIKNKIIGQAQNNKQDKTIKNTMKV